MLPLKWKQQKKLQQKNFLFFQEYEKNFGSRYTQTLKGSTLLNKSRSSATNSWTDNVNAENSGYISEGNSGNGFKIYFIF